MERGRAMISTVPIPGDMPSRVPVDARALGFLLARCGLPQNTAIEWSRDLDRRAALRVIVTYDEEVFDPIEGAKYLRSHRLPVLHMPVSLLASRHSGREEARCRPHRCPEEMLRSRLV